MRVLVTGGAGFIGSHVVDALVANRHEVAIIDDLSTGFMGNIIHLMNPDKIRVFIYDITKPEHLAGVFTNFKPEAVIHLAAWARVQRSSDDPIGTHNVNVTGTLNLLEACRLFRVEKFIYSSSSSVYGDQGIYFMWEDLKPNPISLYALHKYISERYCERYTSLFGMNATALRYFNVYGPRQVVDGAYSLVVGKFFKQLKENEKLTVYGDGLQTRAYTWVEDVARANLLALEASLDGYNVFNVGTDQETSVVDIARAMTDDENINFITPNPRGHLEERRKAADYSKIKKVLGWEPTVSIQKGIRLLQDYYANNPSQL